MPKLVHLYITQTLIGFAASAVFVAGLLWLNVANLWHLVTHDPAGLLAVGLLWLFNGIVFAGVQFGVTVMRMAEKDTGPRGGHGAQDLVPELVAIPVEADRPRRLN